MNEKYILVAITEDCGKLQDGTPWTGKRVIAQIDRNNNSRQTVILKAAKAIRGLDSVGIGGCFVPYYDRNGRVISVNPE